MKLSIEFTDDPGEAEGLPEGSLAVTAEGEFNGKRVGPVCFSYKPTSSTKPAPLEVATMAREMYRDLLDRI